MDAASGVASFVMSSLASSLHRAARNSGFGALVRVRDSGWIQVS